MEDVYHIPVMLHECLDALQIDPEGTYVDVTFGGGGHAKAILSQLESGKLVGFDQDEAAAKNATALKSKNLVFVGANFKHLKRYLRVHGISQVDGILADLGVSSRQIDEAERGFSTRFDGDLDMRMDRSGGITAKDVVNDYPEEKLAQVLKQYGEIPNYRQVMNGIVRARSAEPITTTGALAKAVTPYARKGKEFKFQAQVFQAIRIEVNDEMGALKEFLEQCPQVLRPGGRLVILTYHSLEDRLVKNFLKFGNFEGSPDKDFYGNLQRPLVPVQSKPLVASPEEIITNRRSRSAKLRVAEASLPTNG
jgi:16S rRNA (cytosine1402-N4)-methyltransferase